MSEQDSEEQIKEVYAFFGLAIYFAQCLEHEIVNSLMILDLIPNHRGTTATIEDWGNKVDQFMDKEFEKTLGQMIRRLEAVTAVPTELKEKLTVSLKRRNFLAHHYFRERAEVFMSERGRSGMILELQEAKELFQSTDALLKETYRPIRERHGLTDERIEFLFQELKRQAEAT